MKRSALLALAVLAPALAACNANRNRLTVHNRASLAATSVTVRVCGQELVFGSLGPGQSAHRPFRVTTDSSFQVRAAFADGTLATNEFGYVTGGAGAYGNRIDLEIAPDHSIRGVQN